MSAERVERRLAAILAADVNPRDRRSRSSMVAIGIAEFFNRHFDEAVPRLVLSLEEFPHWATPYGVLAACYAHMGRIAEARAITHRFQTMGLVPKASQFRNPENRELFLSGLRLAMGETEG